MESMWTLQNLHSTSFPLRSQYSLTKSSKYGMVKTWLIAARAITVGKCMWMFMLGILKYRKEKERNSQKEKRFKERKKGKNISLKIRIVLLFTFWQANCLQAVRSCKVSCELWLFVFVSFYQVVHVKSVCTCSVFKCKSACGIALTF